MFFKRKETEQRRRKTDVDIKTLEGYMTSLEDKNTELHLSMNKIKAEMSLLQEESIILESLLTLVNELIICIMNKHDDFDTTLNRTLRAIGFTFKASQVWLGRLIYNQQRITCMFSNVQGNNTRGLTNGLIFDFEEAAGRFEKTLKNGESIIFNPINNQTEEESFFYMWGNKTLILIPILNDNILWGVIGISYYEQVRTFTPKEKIVLKLISKLISVFVNIRIGLQELTLRKNIMDRLTTAMMIYSWQKDSEGRYTFVDKKWASMFYPGFFKTKPLIGETDISAITEFRKKPGNTHTFGELCLGSDQICIQEKKTIHFLEVGRIKNKLLMLHVIKQPSFDGVIYKDIIGIAYNITFVGLDDFKRITDKLIEEGQLEVIRETWEPLIIVYKFVDEEFGKRKLYSWYNK